MILLDINTVDSLKHIIDSISKLTAPSQTDILSKVDSFYNGAWSKVVLVLGSIGVIVPAIGILINFIQNRSNKTEYEKMLNDSIEKTKLELQSEFDSKVDSVVTELKKQFSVLQEASEGVSYHVQSELYNMKKDYESAFSYLVAAMRCYFEGEDFSNFENALNDLEDCAKHINSKTMEKINKENKDFEYYLIDKLIDALRNDESKLYLNSISKLNSIVDQIKDKDA